MRKAWKVLIACSPLDTRYWFDPVKFCSITFQWTVVVGVRPIIGRDEQEGKLDPGNRQHEGTGEDGAVARLSVDPGVSQTTAALIKELAVWGLRWGKTWLSGFNKQFGEVGV